MTPKLSVVILSYNTKQLLKQCLDSVFKSKGFDTKELDVIIVDNNSSDGSIGLVNKKFTQAKLIKNEKNIGFSAGNNIGIKDSRGKYVLLLNSDAVVYPETLISMIRMIEKDGQIGAGTCRLELLDGHLDPACHRGFPTPWNAFCYFVGLEKLFPRSRLFGGYHQGWKNPIEIHEVDVISGAFFLVRREVIDKVGLLDERFFIYGEDIDWCYRIKQAGYKIIFNPRVKALHFKKQSGRAHTSDTFIRKSTRYHFIDTMELFYQKHYLNIYPRIINWLVLTTLNLVKKIP